MMMMKMERKLVWVGIAVMMFVSIQEYYSSEGCLEQERSALLQLKQSFNSTYFPEDWVDDHNSDCCGWFGVSCNDTTKRVTEIHLENVRPNDVGDWYLNASLFSPFKQLESLALSGNSIAGCLENEGFDRLSTLLSLLYLDLSDNNLKERVDVLGLCKLVHLQHLNLNDNHFDGNLPWCLANLTTLQVLDIGSNQFTGNVSSSPLVSLTSIERLDISQNHFRIPISLEPFFNHSQLKIVFAEDNMLFAESESQHSLYPKFQLAEVRLSGCKDNSSFPKFLYHQHDLQVVRLIQTNLKGKFPIWLLENNTHLLQLFLTSNFLSGPFQLSNHFPQLTRLDISNNFFHGHIPTEIGAYLPSLRFLRLSENALDGSIPSSLGDLKQLEVLDLSTNQLSGEVPEHLAMGCFHLLVLSLSNNKLGGQIFSQKLNLTMLASLRLDDNHFTGSIPETLSNCSTLVELSLGDNHFSGRIPGWLGNITSITYLIMPNNYLEGPIPMEFCQLNHLEVLELSENNITGSLPSCFNRVAIKQVHLSKNRLQGQLNDALGNTSNLIILDLSYNYLNGSIPSWIGNLSTVSFLKLSHNNFEGEVPSQLCLLDQLHLLDLSHNNLSGHIPSCLNITAPPDFRFFSSYFLLYADVPPLQGDGFLVFTTKGMSYSYKGKLLSFMAGIDLSCNNLLGEIPHQIGQLNSIRALNLSHNNLMGLIPSTLSNLMQIESLDLSYNDFSGRIPPELVKLTTLAVFSVAHNNLSGKVLDCTAQFSTFDDRSYEGNPLLSGLPLSKSCNTNGSQSLPPRASIDINEEDNSLTDMDIFFISFAVAYIFAVLGVALVLYINPYWRRAWFYFVEISYYFVVDHLPF